MDYYFCVFLFQFLRIYFSLNTNGYFCSDNNIDTNNIFGWNNY